MRLLTMVSGITVALSLALGATLAQGAQNQQGQPQRGMQRGDIVETAKSAGEVSTLVKALEESGLAQDLKRGGPYTIFAPTDAAFQKLGQKKVDDLMRPENKAELAKILKYHVVPGQVSPRAGRKMRAETLEGGKVEIDSKEGRVVQVNRARVSQPDIPAENGVIYPLDEVLMPKG